MSSGRKYRKLQQNPRTETGYKDLEASLMFRAFHTLLKNSFKIMHDATLLYYVPVCSKQTFLWQDLIMEPVRIQNNQQQFEVSHFKST
jgi:hypothetical protein